MTFTEISLIVIMVLLLVILVSILLKRNEKGTEELKSEMLKFLTKLESIDPLIRDEFSRSREEINKNAREDRSELGENLNLFSEKFEKNITELNEQQRQKFRDFGEEQQKIRAETESKLEKIRETLETQIKYLQEENAKKLEEMRNTVDEKLQTTVEKRFNESFKLISDRLEQVHKGLGEMQTLATGVGDLKKVLSNVKTRGNLGEIQLESILDQIFSPEQYEKNVQIKEGTSERVEFAIKMPGTGNDKRGLLLPIDSKFPVEDYQRLMEAYENAGKIDQIESIGRQFENAVKKNAKDIREKYINPPVTTDFAIMFVPTEGLYAEILRRTGLFEILRREFRVTVVGPTNLSALLSSLQMGFKTLAIEKRSSEVWEILGAVKTEFGKFGDVLEKTKKKLVEATNTIDNAGVRSRSIERQLGKVQELPSPESGKLLEEGTGENDSE